MADTSNLSSFLGDIANAIRTKKETTEQIAAADFDKEILSIEGGLDISDADATADDILSPKVAYTSSGRVTGKMEAEYQYEPIGFVENVSSSSNLGSETIVSVIENHCVVTFVNYQVKIYSYKNNEVGNLIATINNSYNGSTLINWNAKAIYKIVDNSVFVLTYGRISSGSDTTNNVICYKVNLDSGEITTGTRTNFGHPLLDGSGRHVSNMSNYGEDVIILQASQFSWNQWYIAIKVNDDATIASISEIAVGYSDDRIYRSANGFAFAIYNNGIEKFCYFTGTSWVSLGAYASTKIAPLDNGYCVLNGTLYQYTSSGFTALGTLQNYPYTQYSGYDTFYGYDKYLLIADSNSKKIIAYEIDYVELTASLIKSSAVSSSIGSTGFTYRNVYMVDLTNVKLYNMVYELSEVGIPISISHRNRMLYNTGDATIISDEILSGEIAYGAEGKIIGTMTNNGELEYTPSESEQVIPSGYTSGGKVLSIDITQLVEYENCLNLSKNILGDSDIVPYTKLVYLESNGGQYIDTGIIPTNHYIEIKAQYLSQQNDAALFGVSSPGYHITWYSNKWYYGNGGTELNGGAEYLPDQLNTIIYNKDGIFSINGNVINSSLDAKDTHNLFILRRPRNVNGSAAARIYYCKIYDKSTNQLVRDFIPVRDLNGEVCLYDNITKEFFRNSGTGTFVGGEA